MAQCTASDDFWGVIFAVSDLVYCVLHSILDLKDHAKILLQ